MSTSLRNRFPWLCPQLRLASEAKRKPSSLYLHEISSVVISLSVSTDKMQDELSIVSRCSCCLHSNWSILKFGEKLRHKEISPARSSQWRLSTSILMRQGGQGNHYLHSTRVSRCGVRVMWALSKHAATTFLIIIVIFTAQTTLILNLNRDWC